MSHKIVLYPLSYKFFFSFPLHARIISPFWFFPFPMRSTLFHARTAMLRPFPLPPRRSSLWLFRSWSQTSAPPLGDQSRLPSNNSVPILYLTPLLQPPAPSSPFLNPDNSHCYAFLNRFNFASPVRSSPFFVNTDASARIPISGFARLADFS